MVCPVGTEEPEELSELEDEETHEMLRTCKTDRDRLPLPERGTHFSERFNALSVCGTRFRREVTIQLD